MKRRILLGLTGSVASVLYCKLIKELQTLGIVDVILTDRAMHFVDVDVYDVVSKNGGESLF
jgi:phosphopantothenoylcysteine synthetase/decarboxylase